MNAWTQAFAPALEREFLSVHLRDSLVFVRTMLGLGIALYLVFGVGDNILFPEVREQIWTIRAGIVAPIVLAVIAATYSRRLQRYWQAGSVIAVSAFGGGVIAMAPHLPEDALQIASPLGLQLVLIYSFSALRLRFVHAVAISSILVLAFLWQASASWDFPRQSLVIAGIFLGGSLFSGALASYLLERFSRLDFLRRRENAALLKQLSAETQAANEANRSKTRFLATASHDLRQPLHAVGLLVDVLRERLGPGEDRQLTEKVHQAVRSMEDQFNGLLDISRLDSGVVPVNRSRFPMARLAGTLRTKFAPLAETKGIDLQIADSDLWLDSDPLLLERILANLIDNAIKYTDRGTVTMTTHPDTETVRIVIADTGRGIPAELTQRVFDEFFQIGRDERDRQKGLGIGLSIVRRLATLLSHPLEVQSTVGEGTQFTIMVPLGSSGDDARSARGVNADDEELKGRFILVIDDEPDVRDAMQLLLDAWGCSVLTAADGAGAIGQLQSCLREPDLIVCDYRLREGETGLEAIDAVLAALESEVPAIVLTGEIGDSDIERIRVRGLPVAHKPIHGANLKRLIAAHLRSTVHPEAGSTT